MTKFVSFMSSAAGRILRILAGGGLLAWGLLGIEGSSGYIVAGIAALPILTGLMNICLIGPLLGAPLRGSKAQTSAN